MSLLEGLMAQPQRTPGSHSGHRSRPPGWLGGCSGKSEHHRVQRDKAVDTSVSWYCYPVAAERVPNAKWMLNK